MPIIVQRYTIAEDVQSVPQAKPAGTGGDPLLELLAAADKCDHDAPNLPTTPTFSERRDGEHVSSLGGVRGGAGLTVEVEFGSSPDSVSAPTAAGTPARTPVVEGHRDSSEHQSDDDCGRPAPSAEPVNADDNSVAAMERWSVATVDEDDHGDDDIEGSGPSAIKVFQASVAADGDVHARGSGAGEETTQTMGQDGGKIAVYRSGRAGGMGARLEYNQSVFTPSMQFYLSVYLSLCIHACMQPTYLHARARTHTYAYAYEYTRIYRCRPHRCAVSATMPLTLIFLRETLTTAPVCL